MFTQKRNSTLAISTLILIATLSLMAAAGLAQRPQGPWLETDLSFQPSLPKGSDAALVSLTVHNTGTETASFDSIATSLPLGASYVGQALGSGIEKSPESVDGQLVWSDEISLAPDAQVSLRFWAIAPTGIENVARASILNGNEVLATLEAGMSASAASPQDRVSADAAIATEPALPDAIQVAKTATPTLVESGHEVAYSVTFTNDGPAVTLDSITDILPPPFYYVGLAPGSDVDQEPTDGQAPEIVWTGPFVVPANDTLVLRYWAWVPPETPSRVEPYTNEASAQAGATTYGPAEADVQIKAPRLVLEKAVTPTEVQSGEMVSYTITVHNEGTGAAKAMALKDTLPSGFEFVDMDPGSDIQSDPSGTSGTITWSEMDDLEPGETITLVYSVRASSSAGANATNEVYALIGDEPVGPATATVRVRKFWSYLPMVSRGYDEPRFTVTKTVDEDKVDPGATVTYSARFVNEGDKTAVLGTIRDELPNGFQFLSMAGGDVAQNPVGNSGTIVWNGPWTVAPNGTLDLIYRVRVSDEDGVYTNRITATAQVGRAPQQPGRATVTVVPPIFFQDGFENGVGNWTPFLNYWRLNPYQWFHDPGQGYNGTDAYTHVWSSGTQDPHRGAEDALTMYLGEGSSEWTDYRFSTRFKVLTGHKAGVWFRGTYEESDLSGQWLTGYYFMVRVNPTGDDSVDLLQLRTENDPGDPPPYFDYYLYHFSNPYLLKTAPLPMNLGRNQWYKLAIEVEGPHIRCYVNDQLVLEHTDNHGDVFLTGTVGLKTYGSPRTSYAIVKYDDVLVEALD
jgi:uncharacterized repeat protein (TIGR01451 family)